MKPFVNRILLYIWTAAGLLLAGCSKESVNENLGPLPTPDFTVTPVAGNANKVVFASTTPGTFLWLWNFGNGSSSRKNKDTVLFSQKGDYTVVLTAFNKAGNASVSKKVTIANDYAGENILKGSDMEPGSATNWTIESAGGNVTTTAWTGGGLKFSNGTGSAQTNVKVWQAVTVEAGKQYKFSATVKGSGATNTWYEVFFGATKPTAGSDYSDNKFIALSTWAGCAVSAFNGDIANIGCDGSGVGKSGIMTFATSGTIYFVMKVGSWDGNLGADGILVDNVTLSKL